MIANKFEWSDVTKFAVTSEAEICRYYKENKRISCNGINKSTTIEDIELHQDDLMCMIYYDYEPILCYVESKEPDQVKCLNLTKDLKTQREKPEIIQHLNSKGVVVQLECSEYHLCLR